MHIFKLILKACLKSRIVTDVITSKTLWSCMELYHLSPCPCRMEEERMERQALKDLHAGDLPLKTPEVVPDSKFLKGWCQIASYPSNKSKCRV